MERYRESAAAAVRFSATLTTAHVWVVQVGASRLLLGTGADLST